MPDVSAISAGISSVRVAIDIAKEIKGVASSYKDAEIKLKIADLLEAISEVKIRLVEAKDENLDLRQKIKDLEDALSKQDEVIFRDGYYFLAVPQEGKPEGPFCTNCFSKYKSLSLLSEVTNDFRVFGKYHCPSCDKRFDK